MNDDPTCQQQTPAKANVESMTWTMRTQFSCRKTIMKHQRNTEFQINIPYTKINHFKISVVYFFSEFLQNTVLIPTSMGMGHVPKILEKIPDNKMDRSKFKPWQPHYTNKNL